jgi:hypothetical protein
MTYTEIKDEITRLVMSAPKSNRAELLHSLLDDVYAQLQQPITKAFVPSSEQRMQHISKLCGKEFYVRHHNSLASLLINSSGKFCSLDGNEFERPGPALYHQWKNTLPKNKTSYNGWTAKDSSGKQIDDYIRYYVINC